MLRVFMNVETSDWIQLHHKVRHGTVLGLLLINLYVNYIELKTCEIIQYDDDTVLLTSHCELEFCKKPLERSIEVILDHFKSLAFKLIAYKLMFL